MDSKMFWKTHILDKIKNAKRQLYAMSSVITKTWGPQAHLLKWAYTGIIRPALSYAAVSWAHEANTAGIQQKLLQLDRLAMTNIASAQRSTTTRGLAILYNILPLNNFLNLSLIHI